MDDSIIIKQLKQTGKQQQAFNELVKHTKEMLYWHIRKMVYSHQDADDLLQETYVKAWKNLGSFRGDSKLTTWLYRIATNETLSFLKKAEQTRKLYLNGEDLKDFLSDDPLYSGDDILIELEKAILTLPKKQRLIFNMRYYDDLPYEDISLILGTSIGGLKASYHHAKRKIEAYIKEYST